MTSAQPEETRGHGPQDSPSFKPGVEICSSNFVVRLSTDKDGHVCFVIYYLRANGARDGLQYASSEFLTELVDNLNLVETQIKRDGVESKPQVLGRRVGVGISSRHYTGTDTETFVAELLVGGDGRHWKNSFGGSFDVSLISELRQLTSEVLDLMRKEAIREQKGLGFKFKAT